MMLWSQRAMRRGEGNDSSIYRSTVPQRADEAFLIGGVEKTSCGDYFVWMRFDSRVEATFACVTFGTNIAKLGFVRPSHQHI